MKTIAEQIAEAERSIKKTKYHSQKTEIDGIVFDSKKEANRYAELKILERAEEIHHLQRQVSYLLIPAQYAPDYEVNGKIKKGKLLERECKYIADFVYENDNGEIIVEDTKGIRTPDYKIKKKLMLWLHGISIEEM